MTFYRSIAFSSLVMLVGCQPRIDEDPPAPCNTTDASVADAEPPAPDAAPETSSSAPDAGDADVPHDASPAAALCNVDDPFDAPEPIKELNTPDHEYGLRLSADGKKGYFARGPAVVDSGHAMYDWMDLYEVDVNADGSFGAPRLMNPPSLLDQTGDLNPSISANGLTLYFDSYRQDRSIYFVTRPSTSAPFGVPTRVPLFDYVEDFEPFVVADGQSFYFTSSNPYDDTSPRYHTWRATLNQGAVAKIEHVFFDGPDIGQRSAVLSPDETVIYFAGLYTGALTFEDIYMAKRASTDVPFEASKRLDVLNANGADFPSYITPDACTIYFASMRNGPWDLYRARRKPSGAASKGD